jgi:ketopantoate reductase
VIGELDGGMTERLAATATLFEAADLPVETTDNIQAISGRSSS